MTRNKRAQLAEALKRLRFAAGMTGYQMAEHLGIDQSTVSKIENGRQRASVAQVDTWCDATAATQQLRDELRELAQDVLAQPQTWRAASKTGSTNFQPQTQRDEAAARQISFYQPAVIPGLLQTATYARRVFSSGPDGVPADIAERVVGRMERQRVLYDESKLLRFIIPESALRWPFGPVDEHLEQLDRVGEVMARPNVDIRILRMEPNPNWRLGGFVLYEELADGGASFVHFELLGGPLNIDEPDQVDLYQRVYANLLDSATAGEAGREVLAGVLADLRQAG